VNQEHLDTSSERHEEWDRQLKEDIKAGRLEALADQALVNLQLKGLLPKAFLEILVKCEPRDFTALHRSGDRPVAPTWA
jgi:hypothetical protein